jgi:hypothetical protein
MIEQKINTIGTGSVTIEEALKRYTCKRIGAQTHVT